MAADQERQHLAIPFASQRNMLFVALPGFIPMVLIATSIVLSGGLVDADKTALSEIGA
ncbi:MAG: hypothetical protein JWN66_2071 [Sphingomonas bacterium]|uniref:hypothetical protein n=1 Tax=Sphingomonas bacterium TaxID=1895847 RepID=UPI002606AE71|nr:hypothetical protein [Sphingomonas bacterium]MDB5704955.1 hypothetical protein [Sphingomonas bacterium]